MGGDVVIQIKYLPDLCENLDFRRKPITEKDRVEGEIPYYGASGVVDYVDGYIFDEELLLVSEDGANLLARSTPIAFSIKGKTWVNNHAHVLKFSNKLIQKYVELYLNSISLEPYVTGSAQPKLNQKRLNEIPIPLPELNIMSNIIEAISQINELIALRKEQLAKLDQLVKSRFIELFGDPIRNTQNRPTTDFINVVKMQRGFDLPVQDRQQDGGIPVFGSNGALDRHNVAKVKGGGVITGRSGTIGKVYYTEGDYWPLNTSLFSVDTHGNNIIYLAYLLQMYDLSRFTEGTGVPTLNRNKFHNKPIIDVPLNEQEQFAVFVKQTDKSKLAIQQSLDKLETLKKSLMQEYFG
ncbi:MAG: hypothetical protein E7437_04430 [Ruminococcaceae bacterium]|nr:hypothetical protein [Oscillospiraceae bacterium]